MNLTKNTDSENLKRQIAFYNMIPNLIWSVLAFVPISIFCYNYLPSHLLYIFLAISIAFLFLPNAFFDSIQLSKNASFYTKTGVRIINKFTQNGTFLNRIVKRKYPDYKVISNRREKIKGLIGQTYMFEKFHFFLFLFFSFTAGYAFLCGYMSWGVVFVITNIVFNVYPALLQQYIRTKLQSAQTL